MNGPPVLQVANEGNRLPLDRAPPLLRHVPLPVLRVPLDLLRALDADLRDDLLHDLVYVDAENLAEEVFHPVLLRRVHSKCFTKVWVLNGIVKAIGTGNIRPQCRARPRARENKRGQAGVFSTCLWVVEEGLLG